MDSFTAIGVDPGLADTGFAVIEVVDRRGVARAWDTISTNAKEPVPKRLETIYSRIVEILKQWNTGLLVLEDVYSLPDNSRQPSAVNIFVLYEQNIGMITPMSAE